jgi:hypothetical protein
MQPYFFPYLGYFQLIQAVDTFVIYDDVQYIKGGWINRNYILGQGQKQRFGLPVEKASPNKRIHELSLYTKDNKLLKSIALHYAKAPFYKDVYPLVEEVLAYPDRNLARFLNHSLKKVCAYLGLEREWQVASLLGKKSGQSGQARVLDICTQLGAEEYINLPGGMHLYTAADFIAQGIELCFLKPCIAPYPQYRHPFVPDLSIIDVLMFNSKEQCANLLGQCDIVDGMCLEVKSQNIDAL